VRLGYSLPLHEVETAFERAWHLLTNGGLLEAAERAGFECFITTDQNLRDQQPAPPRRLATIVLLTTDWRLMRHHAARVAAAVASTARADRRDLVSGSPRLSVATCVSACDGSDR
jgi:hypothetical protein